MQVEVLESYDAGRSFHILDIIQRSVGSFVYHPGVQAPDSVVLRFCCPGSCYRIDTLILNAKSSIIRKIAPNPFDPESEVCEIFSVPAVQSTVTLRIYDQNDHVVTQLVKDELRKAQRVYCDRWDGKTDDGKIVAIGLYYVVMDYSDGSREFYPVFVKRN